jgi:hypothetical protein
VPARGCTPVARGAHPLPDTRRSWRTTLTSGRTSKSADANPLAGLWGGFVAGFGLAEAYFDDDFVLGFGLVWLMSAAIGGVIVASRGIRRWRIFSLFRADRIEADPDRPVSDGFVR